MSFESVARLATNSIELSVVGTKDIQIAERFVAEAMRLLNEWPSIHDVALPKLRRKLSVKEKKALDLHKCRPSGLIIMTDSYGNRENSYYEFIVELTKIGVLEDGRSAVISGLLSTKAISVELSGFE